MDVTQGLHPKLHSCLSEAFSIIFDDFHDFWIIFDGLDHSFLTIIGLKGP